ncbi:glycine zipper 2TM domain-containing protein [Croceicoccus naphthovorans]|uniref:17 kDa surface antigen n=1 Tax=Croceicoccus naphthovorans TaxID=1348774 RepID=A0A0G3XDP0_9SPHN|nr:glycine zipper 2TM domain-containing protein [Croceicoccus naphthovorans]AKM09640.1 hypothetical protein AB433_06035 [Croceicoccus naphthovorans]MBB3990758.1 hypothetical protein [Croceicoccus naphthovorans]
MKKTLIVAVAAAGLALPAAPAFADPPSWAPAHGYRDKHERSYRRGDRYYAPRQMRRGDRYWRGDDGRYYCKRDDGTTGLIIGAAGGALLGREIDGGRDRTTGTILGAAAGAIIGRSIDRGDARCR